MKYDIEAKILGYDDEWDRNSNEILITFESLEPFYDAGINYGELNKRVYIRELQNTLFVNKATDDWPTITFVEIQSAVDMNFATRLDIIEQSIKNLKDLVKRFVNS